MKKEFLILLGLLFISFKSHSITIKNEGPPGWYSGSYLPFSDGPLTQERNKNKGERKKSTTAKRLDLATSHYGKSKSQLEGFLKDYIYKKDAESWQGLCDQWSASNNDVIIKNYLLSAEKLKCKGGVVLSKGDLQELFTAFYKSWDIDYAGERDYTPIEEREDAYYFAKDQLNRSNFPAHILHEKLHHYMNEKIWKEEKVGIVLNVDSGPEVWNQPVISIESNIKKLTEKDIAKGEFKVKAGQDHINLGEGQVKHTRTEVEAFRLISGLKSIEGNREKSFSILKAKRGDKDLRLIKRIEQHYYEKVYNNPEISVKALRKGEPKYMNEALKKIVKKTSFKDTKSFLQALAQVKKETLKRAFGKNIKLKKGIKVYLVHSKMKYQEETYYRDTSSVFNVKYYNYILIEGKGKNNYIGSSWMTPLSERPGDLFISPSMVAEQIDLANNFMEYYENGKWVMYKGARAVANGWFKHQAEEKFHGISQFKKAFSKVDKKMTIEQWFQKTTKSKKRPVRTYGMTETPEWEFYEMVGKAIGLRNTIDLYKSCKKCKLGSETSKCN